MNKLKFLLLLILSLVLATSALHSNATALAVDRTDNQIAWGYTYSRTIQSGLDWWDEEGYHIRGRVDIGLARGDVNGVVTVVYNGDFQANEPPYSRPLNGRAYGTIEIRETAATETDSNAEQATWVGAWAYEIKDDVVVSGQLWAVHATAPEMMIIDQVWQSARNVIVHTGFIDQVYCPATLCPDPNDQ
jgi:hypothetical protein